MSRRLDRVVRLLARREDAAAAARAVAARRRAAADVDVAAATDVARSVVPAVAVLSPLELQSLRLRGIGAADHLERAVEVAAARSAEELDAERDRSVAATRRRSVERLAERRRTVSVRDAAVASQRALDGLAVLRQVDS